jgi:hypothetical protein
MLPIVCLTLIVAESLSVEMLSETTWISVPASNSIVLPSRKVISALELSPDFTVSPGLQRHPNLGFNPIDATRLHYRYIRPPVENMAGEGIDCPCPQPAKVEAATMDKTSIDSSFLRMARSPRLGISLTRNQSSPEYLA